TAEPAVYPMKSPFETALRRSVTAENVLLRARLADGTVGFGEASPAEYVTGETPEIVLSALREAASALAGADAAPLQSWRALLDEALPHQPTARSAVEMALLDAVTRSWGVPLWIYFGGSVSRVRTDLTIPITAPDEAGALAKEAAALGYRSLKIKVGGAARE